MKGHRMKDLTDFIDRMQAPVGGIEAIARERERQYLEEGYNEEHDDTHNQDGELARAAACYAEASASYDLKSEYGDEPHPFWPWDSEYWKPGEPDNKLDDRIRVLEKAGALIAAELDRLGRARGR